MNGDNPDWNDQPGAHNAMGVDDPVPDEEYSDEPPEHEPREGDEWFKVEDENCRTIGRFQADGFEQAAVKAAREVETHVYTVMHDGTNRVKDIRHDTIEHLLDRDEPEEPDELGTITFEDEKDMEEVYAELDEWVDAFDDENDFSIGHEDVETDDGVGMEPCLATVNVTMEVDAVVDNRENRQSWEATIAEQVRDEIGGDRTINGVDVYEIEPRAGGDNPTATYEVGDVVAVDYHGTEYDAVGDIVEVYQDGADIAYEVDAFGMAAVLTTGPEGVAPPTEADLHPDLVPDVGDEITYVDSQEDFAVEHTATVDKFVTLDGEPRYDVGGALVADYAVIRVNEPDDKELPDHEVFGA